MAAGWKSGDYRDRPLHELLGDVAGGAAVPAAGSTIAAVGALAAGLAARARIRMSGAPDRT
jgi:hypothetical protein